MKFDVQLIAWVIVFGLGAFTALFLLFSQIAGHKRGGGVRAARDEVLSQLAPLIAAFKPIGVQLLHVTATKDIRELEKKLSDAGLRDDMGPAEFMALRIVSLLAGMGFGLFSAAVVGFNVAMVAVLLMFGFAGWAYPTMWLNHEARQRRQRIFRGLSTTLDVLSISVQAGLEMYEALERVVKIGSEPELDREVDKVLQEINKGGKSLTQAFTDLRDRINMPEVTAFCNVMLMAFQLGASGISNLLAEQADAIRNERVLRAERMTAELPSKILFPIAVFIFPAVLVTVLGPLALRAYLEFGNK